MSFVEIADKKIGEGFPPFVVAEVGINHNGDFNLAKESILAAKNAGADAVKIQTFKTDEFIQPSTPEFEEIKSYELMYEEQAALFKVAKKNDIILISTPEDFKSVDFLESLNVPAYKIASMDMNFHLFVEYVAKKRKTVILSTGMSYLDEVREAVKIIESTGNTDIILLHCVSTYPTQFEDVNLRAIETLKREFPYVVGFSDHTIGVEAACISAILGACMIEKHFTLDKNLPGPDHKSSADPKDLRELVRFIDIFKSTMGNGEKKPALSERKARIEKRRGIYSNIPFKKGEIITLDKLKFLSPSGGVDVKDVSLILGKKVITDIGINELITFDKILL